MKEENNGFLSAAEIFANPVRTKVIEAFGGKITVQELLSGAAIAISNETDPKRRNALTVMACVIDPHTRKPLFAEGDLEKINNLSAMDVVKIVNAVNDLNSPLQSVAEIAKNSEAIPTSASPTV